MAVLSLTVSSLVGPRGDYRHRQRQPEHLPWTSSTTGYIGNTAAGTLTVDGGSDLSSATGYIGYRNGTTGKVTVSGTGSAWTNNSSLYVGDYGSGTVSITGGGTASSGNSEIGCCTNSTGVLTVGGTGSFGPAAVTCASAATRTYMAPPGVVVGR